MRRFNQYSIEEIESLITQVNFNRTINEIHFHHTWKPTKKDYIDATDKERLILGMWRYHTIDRGWDDIGQHFSVAPDGSVWDGRELNLDPASIQGRNVGAIAIEHIGNFDEEKLEGDQLKSSVRLIAAFVKRVEALQNRKPSIIFHREYSAKTCPENNVYKDEVLKMVEESNNRPFKDVWQENPNYEIIAKAKGVRNNQRRW